MCVFELKGDGRDDFLRRLVDVVVDEWFLFCVNEFFVGCCCGEKEWECCYCDGELSGE